MFFLKGKTEHLNGAICYLNVCTYLHTWEQKSSLGKGVNVLLIKTPQVELSEVRDVAAHF